MRYNIKIVPFTIIVTHDLLENTYKYCHCKYLLHKQFFHEGLLSPENINVLINKPILKQSVLKETDLTIELQYLFKGLGSNFDWNNK